MRSSRLAALTSLGCALALLAVPAGAATKKASTAECAGLIDVFRNKPSASIKDGVRIASSASSPFRMRSATMVEVS